MIARIKKNRIRLSRAVTGNLRAQLMLTTVAPVTALLVVLSIVGYLGINRLMQTLVEERDSELVQLAAQQVAGNWSDTLLLLTQVASSDAVRSGDAEASQATLSANLPLAQRFDAISVTDARGVIIASEGGHIGQNMSGYTFYDSARRLRRPVRSQVFEDEAGDQYVAVAVPVFDAYGQFAGCTLGLWDLHGQRLGQAVANVRVGEGGFAYLVDKVGRVLYHPDPALIGADLSQHPAVAALLEGKTGAQTINSNGRTTVVGYAPILLRQLTSSLFADESWGGWSLVTSESWDDIIAPLQPYLKMVIGLLILIITLPLTILAINSRRIAEPLQSLAKQAERVASGEFESQVSIARGPTEVRELELAFNSMVQELHRYRMDSQKYVVSILNSQEQERKRIARELHDETAQALVVLGRRIEMAIELADSQELNEELESLRDMVDDTLQGVRRFTSDLRPPLLEELGLSRTLELLGDRTEREEGFGVDVQIKGKPRPLLPELELGLYRLAQESLSNVRRHARAKHAQLILTYGPAAVTLEVTDDGIGFEAPTDPTELLKSGRLGLMGIHERARLFGGKAIIHSKPEQGTTVQVIIPLTAVVLPANEKPGTGENTLG